MARLGRLVVSALLALAAVLLFSGPAGATHDPKRPAAGNWRMQFPKTPGRADTGVLRLTAVDKAAATAAAAQLQWGSWALGGTGCGPGATAFAVGTFERDSDKGPVVGCFSPTSGIFYGVFKSTKYKVEGGLSGSLPGPMVAGVFPAQPRDGLTTTVIGHFPGDGAKAEEALAGSLCPAKRRLSVRGQTPPQAKCALDRVVFIEGTNAVGAAGSKRAVVRQAVYFLARVASNVVPADVVLAFPPAVTEADIFAKPEASVGVSCGKPAATGTGRQYLLCKLTQAKGRVVVGVHVPKALGGKQLEVELRLARPRSAGQTIPEWLDQTKAAVDIALEIVQLKPAQQQQSQPKPPVAPRELIVGRWVEFVPIGGTANRELRRALPGADLTFVKGVDAIGRPWDDMFVSTRGHVSMTLNNVTGSLYGGYASAFSAEGFYVLHLELIPAGAFSKHFPQECAGFAVQAKAPILCGTVISGDAELSLVLRRMPDSR